MKEEDRLILCNGVGNYVIHCMIEKDVWYSTLPKFIQFRDTFIIHVFRKNILELSFNKYGSNVVEKCITVCSERHRKMLINTLTRSMCFVLKRMLDNEYARYVLMRLFSECSYRQKSCITRLIHVNVVNLCGDLSGFGRAQPFLIRCKEFQQRVYSKSVQRKK